MIIVSAFKWVPPFAAGQVRDHRVRWMLNEVGWPYRMRLLDSPDQKSDAYRTVQPFGQVPAIEEEGRPPIFESGAILVDIALRSGRLIGKDEGERSQILSWVFAALNTIEPHLSSLAEIDFFTRDEELKARRRPDVVASIERRLGDLAKALGDRDYIVGGDFSIADMMLTSILKVVGHTDILDAFPTLATYRDRCFARPAYQKAIADQCAEIAAHSPADMRYPPRK